MALMTAAAASSSMLGSTAPLLVIGALLVALVSYKPIRSWIHGLHSQAQEHLYGPPELYQSGPADNPVEAQSDTAPEAAEATDDFDYSIYEQVADS